MTEDAQQGHPYLHHKQKVIALQSGPRVNVGVLRPGYPWFVCIVRVSARNLQPMGLRYLGEKA